MAGNGTSYKTLKLLLSLRKNGRMKISELAVDLDMSEREVRRLKVNLVLLGYDIRSYMGNKNGGYELVEVGLTDNEWIILKELLQDNKQIYEKIEHRLLNTM